MIRQYVQASVEIIDMTYRNSARVGLAVDRDTVDVAVGSSSRSKRQSRNSGDDRVLRERRVVHDDC